jgi:uncharacterized protein (TIGR03086 family)
VDPLDLYERGSAWTAAKMAAVGREQFGDATPCTKWDVRALLNHIIGGGHLYALIGRGEYTGALFGGDRDFIGEDHVASFEAARRDVLETYREPGALDRTVKGTVGEGLGLHMLALIFVDHMVHGWDLATATGQDATMSPEPADVAWEILSGQIQDEWRPLAFAGIVELPDDARTQDKLLAYTGRRP